MLRSYELTLVFSPELSPEKREEIQKKLFKDVKVVSSDDMGALTLEYPIKHQTKGHYLRVNLSAEPKVILDMKNMIKMMDGILRYLIIKI